MTHPPATILVLGGTTEGRAAARVVEGGGRPWLYSTLGATQQIDTPFMEHLTGPLSVDATVALCRRRGVCLIVDAAHPFAEGVHGMVAGVAEACGIPVIRYGRPPVPQDDSIIWCDGYDHAVELLEAAGVRRLLALTGVRTIPKLRAFWQRRDCRFRVLDRPESVAEAVSHGFPREGLIFHLPGEPEIEVMRRERPDAVLTKESGAAGGFPEKVAAAAALGIPLFAIRRPALPDATHTVYTETGLRRRIDELLPGWFALRSGYTTGTCATAAACAALRGLLEGEAPCDVAITLPGGERIVLPVERMSIDGGTANATATVVKDAGDDPDVTNGARISARVELNTLGEIRFPQGEGVGRVTLPGLGLEPGEPAVNPGPRRMIVDNFASLGVTGADVTISVEGGAIIAQKTFNPKLGIEGGISIIGTTGIVRPFSDEAFVEAIEREIDVARATGCRELVVNSGARSEAMIRALFPDLPPPAFVQYGNFIGATLRAAARAGFGRVTMGLMIGKAVKLAEGHLDTHSRHVTMNREFLVRLATSADCSPDAAAQIARITLARELWTALSPADRTLFMPALLTACHATCDPLLPEGRLTILLIPEEGEIFR